MKTAALLLLATSASASEKVVYFIRHGEQKTTTTPLGNATLSYDLSWDGDEFSVSPRGENNGSVHNGEIVGQNLDQVYGNRRCAEELDRLGLLRAELLAGWMEEAGIVSKLTDVFASHLRRTVQTVAPLAALKGLEVQQYPKDASELNPEGGGASVCPTMEAIKNSPADSTIVVAAHTATIYRIMGAGNGDECAGLGIDTSDEASFPKDDRGAVPRDEYGNIWKVSIDSEGNATFEERRVLSFSLGDKDATGTPNSDPNVIFGSASSGSTMIIASAISSLLSFALCAFGI